MKVILKNEVDNLGLPGDVVSVADGYGRNYLIPRGLAIIATRGAMTQAEALTRSRKVRESQTLGSAEAAAQTLAARTLRIPARVDDRGRLYGSVGAVDVQRVLKQRGHDVERRRIELKGTFKEIGSYDVPVRVHPQVTATLTVEVVDEEGRVTVAGGQVEPDVDEAAVAAAAADAAEGSDTDVDVLAEQAIEAAKDYEGEQIADERAQRGAGGSGDGDTGTADRTEADKATTS